jgi:hypothetical protein
MESGERGYEAAVDVAQTRIEELSEVWCLFPTGAHSHCVCIRPQVNIATKG